MSITVNQVSKCFSSKYAVNNCTITFDEGKVYGLLGPNGSGKTTFMKMIIGLLKPTNGEILIDNMSIGAKTKSIVAFMPTENYFYRNMKIIDVKNFFKDLFNDFDVDSFHRNLLLMGLNEEFKVKNLSSGQVNRLKVVITMARKTKYIMLDEPLNGIDLVSREKIMACILNEAKEGSTIILSSHLVNEIEQILDEVVFIKEGKIVLQGEADQLRSDKNKSITDIYKEVFRDDPIN